MAHQYSLPVAALCVLISAGTLALPQAIAAQELAPCGQECLKGFVDQYLDVLETGDPSGLPVATSVKYTENGRVLGLGEGLWKTAGTAVSYRDYVLDPQSGGAVVLTAVKEYDAVAQMMLRLKIANDKISEIETIVVRTGDQRWFAPENLDSFSNIFAEPVQPAERHSREQLIEAADAYFTAIQTEGTPEFRQAPFGEGMNRYENGLRTTNVSVNPISERHTFSAAEQLERAFYKGVQVMDRRYPVVDVEHGSVLGIVTFRRDGPDTGTLLLSEVFKVTGGKLREIRAVMLNLPNGASTGWKSPISSQ